MTQSIRLMTTTQNPSTTPICDSEAGTRKRWMSQVKVLVLLVLGSLHSRSWRTYLSRKKEKLAKFFDPRRRA